MLLHSNTQILTIGNITIYTTGTAVNNAQRIGTQMMAYYESYSHRLFIYNPTTKKVLKLALRRMYFANLKLGT